MKREELFRTCVFGGYNKEDVMGYIRRLESELERQKQRKEEPLPWTDEVTGDDMIIFNDQNVEVSDIGSADEICILKEKLKQAGKELEQARIQLAEKERQIERKGRELEDKEWQIKKSSKQLEDKENQLKESGLQLSEIKKECGKLQKEHEAYEDDYRAIKNVLLNARVDAGVIVAKAQEKAKLMMEETKRNVQLETRRSAALLVDHLKANQEGLDLSKLYLEQQLKSIDDVKQQIEGIRSSIENMCGQAHKEEGNTSDGKSKDVTIDEEFEFFSEEKVFGAGNTDPVKE